MANIYAEIAESTYRSGAKRRGLIWDLSLEQVAYLILSPCYYCGAIPLPKNGIDRVDNDIGYLMANVVTACAPCNRMKHTQTQEEFVLRCKNIARRHGGPT